MAINSITNLVASRAGNVERIRARALQWAFHEGEQNLFTLMISFADRGLSPDDAQKRWESFKANFFASHVRGRYWIVMEPQSDGTPQYHVLGALDSFRDGSVWNKDSHRWTFFGHNHQHWFDKIHALSRSRKYGLGICHIEPVRPGNGIEASVGYFAKYLTKTLGQERLTCRPSNFGSAWRSGASETLLYLGQRRREMLRTFGLEYRLDYEDIVPYAASMYHWMPEALAVMHLWREHIVPFYEHWQLEPF